MTDQTRLTYTKALVAAGLIFYIPANILPVMTITITGDVEHLTILGGVQELADSGLAPIAALVFCASIVIPFLKLAVMCWLLMMLPSTAVSAFTRLLRPSAEVPSTVQPCWNSFCRTSGVRAISLISADSLATPRV